MNAIQADVPLAAALLAKVRRDFAGAPDADIELFASLVAGEPRAELLLGLGATSHIARYHVITSALMREGRWVHAFRSATRLERAERAYVRALREQSGHAAAKARPADPVSARPVEADAAALDPATRAAIHARVNAMTPEQQAARLDELLQRREAMLARNLAGRPQDPPQPDTAQQRPPGHTSAPPPPVPDG